MFAMCRGGRQRADPVEGTGCLISGKPGLLGAPPIPGISLPTLRGGGSGRRAQGTSHSQPLVPSTRHGALFSSRPGPALPPVGQPLTSPLFPGKEAGSQPLLTKARGPHCSARRDGGTTERGDGHFGNTDSGRCLLFRCRTVRLLSIAI